MAKKTISFSLEQDLIEMINDVKVNKNLSSRSAALERILLSKQVDKESIRNTVLQILSEDIKNMNVSVTDKEKAMDEVEKSINDSYSNMPD